MAHVARRAMVTIQCDPSGQGPTVVVDVVVVVVIIVVVVTHVALYARRFRHAAQYPPAPDQRGL